MTQVITKNLKVMLYIVCVMSHLLFSFDTPFVQFSFFRCAFEKVYDFFSRIIPIRRHLTCFINSCETYLEYILYL